MLWVTRFFIITIEKDSDKIYVPVMHNLIKSCLLTLRGTMLNEMFLPFLLDAHSMVIHVSAKSL